MWSLHKINRYHNLLWRPMMVDLILRPSGLAEKFNKPWSLQLRSHESCGETEYMTLARVDDNIAQTIIRGGAPTWLFGEPDWQNEHTKGPSNRHGGLRKKLPPFARAFKINGSKNTTIISTKRTSMAAPATRAKGPAGRKRP